MPLFFKIFCHLFVDLFVEDVFCVQPCVVAYKIIESELLSFECVDNLEHGAELVNAHDVCFGMKVRRAVALVLGTSTQSDTAP